jgi:peptidoglycan/LPS O-acetylase OafA/YrhL
MKPPWRFRIALLGGLALTPAAIIAPNDRFSYTVGFTLAYVGFGTILLLYLYPEASAKRSQPGLLSKVLATIGVYSYTIYLWHLPMAEIFAAAARRLPMVNEYALHAIYLAASIGIGIAFSKLVERPTLRIRDRLFPTPILQQTHISWSARDSTCPTTPADVSCRPQELPPPTYAPLTGYSQNRSRARPQP